MAKDTAHGRPDPRTRPARVTLRRAPRRVPRRVLLDPSLRTPIGAQLVRTAREGPVEIACTTASRAARASGDIRALEGAGIRWRDLDAGATRTAALGALLRDLAADGVSTVLTEAGPRLVGALLAADLVDEAWVFASTCVPGDPASAPWPQLDPARFAIIDERRRDDDVVRLWRRTR